MPPLKVGGTGSIAAAAPPPVEDPYVEQSPAPEPVQQSEPLPGVTPHSSAMGRYTTSGAAAMGWEHNHVRREVPPPPPPAPNWWEGNPLDAVGATVAKGLEWVGAKSPPVAAAPVPPPEATTTDNPWISALQRNPTGRMGAPVSGVNPNPDTVKARGYHGAERNSAGYEVPVEPGSGTLPQMLGGRVYPVTQAHTRPEDREEGVHFHGGIDLGMPVGSPIFMPGNQSGTVISTRDEMDASNRALDDPYGPNNNYSDVRVKMSDGTEMVLSHLSDFPVQVGDELGPGQLIGYSGSVMSTNREASAPGHTHMGLLWYNDVGDEFEIDPVQYFNSQNYYSTAPKQSSGDWRIGQRDFETIDPGDYSYRYPRSYGRRRHYR